MVVGWNAGKEGTKLGPREGGRLQARRILAQRHHSAEPGTEDEKVKQTGKRPRTNLVSPFHRFTAPTLFQGTVTPSLTGIPSTSTLGL